LASLNVEGLEQLPVQRIIEGYKKDEFAKEIITVLNSVDTTHHYNRKYQLYEGLIYVILSNRKHIFGEVSKARVYVPDVNTLRTDLVKLFHDLPAGGHRDADATYLHTAIHFFFPRMYDAVRKLVKRCEDCQRTKYQTQSTKAYHQPLEAPSSKPWDDIATDFLTGLPESVNSASGERHNKIQIYVDRLSRKVHLVPGKTTDTAYTTAVRYRDRVFPHEGIPRSIVSDRDPLFTSEFWTHLGRSLGVTFKMSSGHRPQTDGLSERMVGVVTTMISIFVNYRQNDWADYLGMLQFALNSNSVKNRNSQTPFLMTKGYEPLGPADLILPRLSKKDLAEIQHQDSSKSIDFVARQKGAAQDALDAIIHSQDVVARRINKKLKPKTYKVGDKVYLDKNHVYPAGEREKDSFKLRSRWVGPYTVVTNVGHHPVKLDLTGDKLLNHPVYHVESTKPVNSGTIFKMAENMVHDEWVVENVKNFKYQRNVPKWLVDWGGISQYGTSVTSRHTWEPLDNLVDRVTKQPIGKLIEFERERTGLDDTLETGWNYPVCRHGKVHHFKDGWDVYFTSKNDTLAKIAKKLNVSCRKLFSQNILAYAIGDTRKIPKGQPRGANILEPLRKLPQGEQLRVPK
jgi:hypothetical protein